MLTIYVHYSNTNNGLLLRIKSILSTEFKVMLKNKENLASQRYQPKLSIPQLIDNHESFKFHYR